MYDRIDIRARDCGTGINVRDKADHRNVLFLGRRGNRRHHVAVLIARCVREADRPQLGHELIQQHELLRGARVGRGLAVRLSVERDVTQESLDDTGFQAGDIGHRSSPLDLWRDGMTGG